MTVEWKSLFRTGRVAVVGSAIAVTGLVSGSLAVLNGAAGAAEAQSPVAFQFGPQSAAVPTGYTLDNGGPFSTAKGHGWETLAGAPLDMTWATRIRSNVPASQAANIQAFRNGTAVAWHLDLANGTYAVTVGVGDAAYIDSTDTVSANGTPVVKGFKPTAAQHFTSATETVTVTGGKLVLSTASGDNVKLDYVAVSPVTVMPAPVTTAPVTPAPVTTPPVTPAPVITPPPTTAPVTPAPVATAPANLGWFYNPPTNSSDMAVATTKFSTYYSSTSSQNAAMVAKIKAVNPSAKISEYFLLNQIIKPVSGGVEFHNNAAYQPGDFNNLVKNHQDWFLHDANGNMIFDANVYYRMDPGNAGWRAFWLQRVMAANANWGGVFADNTDVSMCGLDHQGRVIPKYTNDATYTDAIAGFLQYVDTNYFAPTGKSLTLNLTNGCGTRDYSSKYARYSTTFFYEGWGVNWHTGYLSTSTWNKELAAVESQTALGKGATVVAQGAQTDTARQQFAFSSYLLVQTPRIAFRYSQYTNLGYGSPWMYANYNAKLGTATGPRYLLANGSWQRDFTNGHVTVNPTTHTSSIVTNS